jgi:hypothetical protein
VEAVAENGVRWSGQHENVSFTAGIAQPMTEELLRAKLSRALSSFDVNRLEPFLSEIDVLYTEDMVFRDPMQTSRGRPAFLEVNRRLAKMARSIRFDVTDETGNDELFYLQWTMHLVPRFGPEMGVEGVSRMRARAGRVFEHVDYWDLGELFASPIGGQKLLHKLFRPFV